MHALGEAFHEDKPAAAAVAGHDTALALVFCTLPSYDLYVTVPLVCRYWNEVAPRAYGARQFSVNSFSVKGFSKTQSLATWMQHHGKQLLSVQLTGFMNSTSSSWWSSIWSAPCQQLQKLTLRACGAPLHPLPFQLLMSMTALRELRLEHIRCLIEPDALSACSTITQLTARACGLGIQHLAAIGQMQQLVELALPGNDFVSYSNRTAGQWPLTSSTRAATAIVDDVYSGLYVTSDNCSSSIAHLGVCNRAREEDAHGSASVLNPLSESAGAWVHGLQQLCRLDISKSRLPAGALDDLTCLTNLTRLSLAHCQLDVSSSTGPGQLLKLQRLQHQAVMTVAGRTDHSLALGSCAAASCAVVGRMSNLLELDVSYVNNAGEQLCRGARHCEVPPALRALDIQGTGLTCEQLANIRRFFPRLDVLCS